MLSNYIVSCPHCKGTHVERLNEIFLTENHKPSVDEVLEAVLVSNPRIEYYCSGCMIYFTLNDRSEVVEVKENLLERIRLLEAEKATLKDNLSIWKNRAINFEKMLKDERTK